MYLLINTEDQATPAAIINDSDMKKIQELGLSKWLGEMEVIDTANHTRIFNEYDGNKVVLKRQKLVDMKALGYVTTLDVWGY